jgi:hypothetical protein
MAWMVLPAKKGGFRVKMSLNVEIRGLPELVRVLERMANFKVPMGEAIELFLQKVIFGAKAIVSVRTGRLQRSLSFWGGDTQYYVGSRLYYAPFVEFGTRRMHARPYLTPNIERNGPALKLYLVEKVEAWLEARGR